MRVWAQVRVYKTKWGLSVGNIDSVLIWVYILFFFETENLYFEIRNLYVNS